MSGGNPLFNLKEILQQARGMQEKMQQELEALRVEASTGGGMVTVRVNGQRQILDLKIDSQLIKDGDTEMIQELVRGAVNQAFKEVDEQMKKKMGALAGNLGLPNLPGLF